MRLSNGQLSSSGTFFYKFVFPVVWISLFGACVFLALQRAGQGAPVNRLLALSITAAWLLGSFFLLRFVVPVLRVQLRDGRLFASNFRREIEIQRSDISGVTQNVWIKVRPITLHLRTDTPFGRRIRFMPPGHVIFAFWKEDPLVAQLRELAGLPPNRA